ncbi:saccharopine dehydrogenase family protein [Brevibacillus laterosporus]|uniref:saccharopine dehydrogenase family protein n=1 Tax=Brevibacillus laterosporus TaxID=1465 RepID=UPI002E215DD7|nr:saccharopine dehydrogenase NADP-binding domain-containing protein [Brevibacillus laterosporus]MED1662805.1 saccharopine dehydrogenase NADP-binding domain-containing protein [Brevibacillus laterosporus]MED1669069.1 saccharopine dehydrogenase NADP-binding domain-containing protein [Brevibacillus laterosporus]MED1720544.1 saccharopine dehydrogenase NADP-binding domain-containing protein [Brevibacillus laterosporus]
MKDTIIVVGGYGHVGRTICKELGEKYPGFIYAAGRNRERAEQFCQSTAGKVKPLQLDISESIDPHMLTQAKLVIMCLDQSDPTFVRSCFQSGTHYVDVSANGSFLAQVERWEIEAKENCATAVLSVGLAPGLTNLLALQAQKLLDQVDVIELAIMLGLGDRHGRAAIEWTVDNLNAGFEIRENNRNVLVNSFTDGKIVDFGSDLGQKRAYRFPFSDQQTLARTLGIPSVSTRLCFDSAVMTTFMAALRASGISRFLTGKKVRNTAINCFSRIRMGGEQFAIKVDAWGIKENRNKSIGCLLHGKNQSNMTAKVAVSVADAIYRSSFPSGVYHIEQLFELENLQGWLQREASIEIHIDGNLYK